MSGHTRDRNSRVAEWARLIGEDVPDERDDPTRDR